MIEPKRLLRLPPARFDAAQTVDVTFGPVPFQVTLPIEVYPTEEYSWARRFIGGDDRLAWPVPFSLGWMAQWRGLTQAGWLASANALTDPRGAMSTAGGPALRPRAVVYSPGNQSSGDIATIKAAVEAGIASVRTQMEAKGVLAARGPELGLSFGSGFLEARFPYAAGTPFEIEVPDVSLTLYGVLPEYEPAAWLAGEVLYLSVCYVQDEEFPFGTMALGLTPTHYEELREREYDLWAGVVGRHSRVRHHVVYVQAPSGEPDPFDADRQAAAQEVADFFSDQEVTMTTILGTLAASTGDITADVASVITEFFDL